MCFDLVCLLILVLEKVELLMHSLGKSLGLNLFLCKHNLVISSAGHYRHCSTQLSDTVALKRVGLKHGHIYKPVERINYAFKGSLLCEINYGFINKCSEEVSHEMMHELIRVEHA